MTDRELMRQAVVALDLAMLHGEYPKDTDIFREISNAANALSARLAQPEPEPDKYLMEIECTKCGAKQDGILTVNVPPQRNEPEPVMLMDAPLLLNGQPLYPAPPQREWRGLTYEEIEDILACGRPDLVNIKKAEQKLKEKNT